MSETTSFNPSDEYINALLCKVAYEGVSVGDSFLDLDSSEFSETERNFLQSNFEVVDSSSDFLSGFKACWIRNKETNEVVYAIAGTDDFPGGLFDYGYDYDICKKGMATEQFIEAYYRFLDVSFCVLRLKFPFSQFFFLVFTFCYQLLSYAFQSASLNFSFGGAYPNTLSPA